MSPKKQREKLKQILWELWDTEPVLIGQKGGKHYVNGKYHGILETAYRLGVIGKDEYDKAYKKFVLRPT